MTSAAAKQIEIKSGALQPDMLFAPHRTSDNNVPRRDEPIIITIDGPAGTGKSSVSGLLAKRLNVDFLDTGAMYRAAALLAIENGVEIPVKGEPSPAAVQRLLGLVRGADIGFKWDERPPALLVGGRNCSRRIRDDDVTAIVSQVATLKEIREFMVERQRAIAEAHPRLVTEGRDQGSKVFESATIKFYLNAEAPVRAARRAIQNVKDKGVPANVTRILRDILDRDARDSSREVDPLVIPRGAIVIDTSHLDREQVVELLHKIVRQRLAKR